MIGVARPSEYAAACRLLASRQPVWVQAAQAEQLLRWILEHEVNPAGLLVARRAGTVTGAILGQITPGRVGSLLPPVGEQLAELTTAAREFLQSAGVTHIQCLLLPADAGAAPALVHAGFRHTTELHTLIRPITTARLPLGAIHVESIREPDVFRATLAATYIDTRDCPELNQNSGESLAELARAFQPNGFVATRNNDPVGVGVVAAAGLGGRELNYLGLIPAARGRGWGRDLLAALLAEFRPAPWTTAVDARNTPARRLYDWAGFAPGGSRAVYLWFPAG